MVMSHLEMTQKWKLKDKVKLLFVVKMKMRDLSLKFSMCQI
jgi:hypothetical protein